MILSLKLSLIAIIFTSALVTVVNATNGGNASSVASIRYVDVGVNVTDDFLSQLRALARRHVAKINEHHVRGKIHWQAVYNEQFGSMLPEQKKYLHGTKTPSLLKKADGSDKPSCHHSSAPIPPHSLPSQFDARSNWPQCTPITGFIYDQSSCGDCWAVASASVITDRNCIAASTQGQNLDSSQADNWASAEDILTCSRGAASSNGCVGGYISSAFSYAASEGVLTGLPYYNNLPSNSAGCKPYPFPPISQGGNRQYQAPACSGSTCLNSASNDETRISLSGSTFLFDGYTTYETEMMNAIYSGGPVAAAMTVHSDLYYYSSGVYSFSGQGTIEGGHAVRIMGWGVDPASAQPYWLVMNSWGASWGDAGTFKIRRGVNECGIESQIAYGQAQVAAGRAKSNASEDKAARVLESADSQ